MWKAHLAAVTWLLYAQLSYSSASAADSSHGSPVCTVPGSVVHTLSLADAPASLKLSATVAAGLVNRHLQAPAVFNILLPTDEAWLLSAQREESALQNCTWVEITIPELWQLAHSSAGRLHPVIQMHQAEQLKGLIGRLLKSPFQFVSKYFHRRYDRQDEGSHAYKYQDQIFDTRGMWKDSFQATKWAFKHLHPECKNTQQMIAVQTPDLMQQGLLADFIVAQQLFAFWLPDLCQPGSSAQKLFWKIAQPAWQQQSLLSVMGYYALQEEIAACSQHHTEVSLVTDWSPNLSFWSMMPAVTQLAQARPIPHEAYSPNYTYLAVIASDGDSLQMNYNSMRIMMEERNTLCSSNVSTCPPVSWTISNRLTILAPFVLSWHYRQAATRQGKDSFLMGPSGYGFTHPSSIAAADPIRQNLINLTAHAASSLDMQAYVHWDDYNNNAVDLAFSATPGVGPKVAAAYEQQLTAAAAKVSRSRFEGAAGGAMIGAELSGGGDVMDHNRLAMELYISEFANTSIKAVFSPIMPYVHKYIDGIVTFREWVRWTDSSVATPSIVAESLLKIPKGSLGYVYKLPDISMQDVEVLGAALQDKHVKLVGYRELTSLANQAKV